MASFSALRKSNSRSLLILSRKGDAGRQADGDHDGQPVVRRLAGDGAGDDEHDGRCKEKCRQEGPPATNRQAGRDEQSHEQQSRRAGQRGYGEQIDDDLKQGRREQDANDRLVEFLEQHPPDWFARERGESIPAVPLPRRCDLGVAQTAIGCCGEFGRDVGKRAHAM